MNNLKSCPFCGSAAELLIVPGRVAQWVVKCKKGCCNTRQHISDHDAEEAWNHRTSDDMTDREKLIIAIKRAKRQSEEYNLHEIVVPFKEVDMILSILKEGSGK